MKIKFLGMNFEWRLNLKKTYKYVFLEMNCLAPRRSQTGRQILEPKNKVEIFLLIYLLSFWGMGDRRRGDDDDDGFLVLVLILHLYWRSSSTTTHSVCTLKCTHAHRHITKLLVHARASCVFSHRPSSL